jgi:hypothetical protein
MNLIQRLKPFSGSLQVLLTQKSRYVHHGSAQESNETRLFKVLVVGQCFKNILLLHDAGRSKIGLTPRFVGSLLLEVEGLLEQITGLRLVSRIFRH